MTEVDECLGTDHAPPEIKGPPHFRQELDEQHGTII